MGQFVSNQQSKPEQTDSLDTPSGQSDYTIEQPICALCSFDSAIVSCDMAQCKCGNQMASGAYRQCQYCSITLNKCSMCDWDFDSNVDDLIAKLTFTKNSRIQFYTNMSIKYSVSNDTFLKAIDELETRCGEMIAELRDGKRIF